MARFTCVTCSGLLAGALLVGCYEHHTADELVLPVVPDADAGTVDPCADVSDDDVSTQMACDPDLAGGTDAGAGGADPCANAADPVTQLLCGLGGSGQTGGAGQPAAGTGGLDLNALLGLLGGGGTGGSGGQATGGLDIASR
jgi:hypothetical protein